MLLQKVGLGRNERLGYPGECVRHHANALESDPEGLALDPALAEEDLMVRVGLFADEPILVRGVESILAGHPGLQLAVVSPSVDSLASDLRAAEVDVALLDLVPELTLGVLSELKKSLPGCRLILWVRSISMELAYQTLELNVRGILRKTLPAEAMIKCLLKVSEGEIWVDKPLTAGYFERKRVSLTPRESQLVTLLAQGLKNKEIGAALGISEGTVKVYLTRLFQKVGVKDRFELALFGLKNMMLGEAVGAVALSGTHNTPTGIHGVRSLLLNR